MLPASSFLVSHSAMLRVLLSSMLIREILTKENPPLGVRR